MADESQELRDLVIALSRLETSVESRDREIRTLVSHVEDNLATFRKDIAQKDYITSDLYRSHIENEKERDKRINERLDRHDDKYTWLTRALIGAFIGILVQTAVIALSMGGS